MILIRDCMGPALAVILLGGCSSPSSTVTQEGNEEPTASVTEALGPNALGPMQSKTVLKLVDDICGDTWCSGDYDFRFRRIACSNVAKTCTLLFLLIPREGVTSRSPSYWRSCKTHDFDGFDSLVTTTPSGYQSLDQNYYGALTECISRIEDKLR
jgi:hypothetical protein